MGARRAVRKALELQREGAGFTFVEILSPCPTIWNLQAVEARRWVAEKMIPVFPLNVFRDRKPTIPEGKNPPQRCVAEVLGLEKGGAKVALAAPVARREHHLKNLSIKIAGFGGQGVLLLGQLLAEIGMREGLEVSWLPSYGPEMRSGSAHCHVCLSEERIGSPLISHPDVLVAMNEISLRKFAPQVAENGLIFYNREQLPEDFAAPQARVFCLSATEIADRLGAGKVANVVLLGALLEKTKCLSLETAVAVLEAKVRNPQLLELDRQALTAGREFVDKEAHNEAISQPDGFAY
jgi:2-oxoisovalerate ferredoxin oxidoreductase beta subunit